MGVLERGVYKIITGKRGAFIGDGHLLEKIRTKIHFPSLVCLPTKHGPSDKLKFKVNKNEDRAS